MSTLFESKEFRQIMDSLDKISAKLDKIDRSKKFEIDENNLTAKEAADILKCTVRTLHNYKNKGLISYTKIEGKLRFKLSDIENFLKNGIPDSNLPSIL